MLNLPSTSMHVMLQITAVEGYIAVQKISGGVSSRDGGWWLASMTRYGMLE